MTQNQIAYQNMKLEEQKIANERRRLKDQERQTSLKASEHIWEYGYIRDANPYKESSYNVAPYKAVHASTSAWKDIAQTVGYLLMPGIKI